MFYDSVMYLSLGHDDTWIAHVPEAQALKTLWDQEAQRTRTERIRLQEGCIKLMRELRLSEEQSGECVFFVASDHKFHKHFELWQKGKL